MTMTMTTMTATLCAATQSPTNDHWTQLEKSQHSFGGRCPHPLAVTTMNKKHHHQPFFILKRLPAKKMVHKSTPITNDLNHNHNNKQHKMPIFASKQASAE